MKYKDKINGLIKAGLVIVIVCALVMPSSAIVVNVEKDDTINGTCSILCGNLT